MAMEISTEENENLVSAIYQSAMEAVHAGKNISKNEDLVYQIERLAQEVNSGASFEQYFRWVEKQDIDSVIEYLQALNMTEVHQIVLQAIKIAFPNGIPEDKSTYDEYTEWNEAQLDELANLFEKFEKYNGAITNRLGKFILTNKLAP